MMLIKFYLCFFVNGTISITIPVSACVPLLLILVNIYRFQWKCRKEKGSENNKIMGNTEG